MTAKELGNQPANSNVPVIRDNTGQFEIIESLWPGMTKREAFAMAAMQGFCTSSSWASEKPLTVARDSIVIADALLSALSKEQP